MAASILVLWNAMGIVFTVVSGICNTGQLCYYDKNMELNKAMAGGIIFLHALTMVLQTLFARKTHMYEAEFHNDISIRLGHDWVLSRKAPLQSVGSTGSFHSSSRRSSVKTIKDEEDPDQTDQNVPVKTIVVVEAEYRKFPPVPVAEPRVLSRCRSKSIPNMRKHPEMLEDQPDLQGGTVVSIYSDSDSKRSDSQKKRIRKLFKHSHRRSKSDGGTCIEKLALVQKDGQQESDSLGTAGDNTPPPQHETDTIKDKKHKHKHKKHKKHKKSKKSRVVPEAEGEEVGKKDKIKAEYEDSNTDSDSNSKDSPKGTDILMQKQEKLQKDQAHLQKQQKELLMKQQQLLQQHEQFGMKYNPPPKYEERDNATPLPHQTLRQNEDENDDDVFK